MTLSFLCIHPIHGAYAGGSASKVGALGDAGAIAKDAKKYKFRVLRALRGKNSLLNNSIS